MADQELSILIKAKDAASRVFKGFENRLNATWRTVKRVTAGLAAFAGATATAVAGLAKLTERGRDVTTVQEAFNRVAGGEGPQALQRMRKQTQGLISDYELMAQANQAVTLGAVETTDQFAELAEGAIALGRAQGVDARRAIESVVTGLARISNRRLDNVGIMVDQTEANERYAEQLGVTVKELTEAQKAEAFRAEGLRQLRIKMQELGGIEEEQGDRVTRITTKIRNLTDRVAVLANESEGVGQFFAALEQGLDMLDERLPGIIDKLGEFGSTLIDVMGIGDPQLRGVQRFAQGATREQLRARLNVETRDLNAQLQALGSSEAEARRRGLLDEQGRITPLAGSSEALSVEERALVNRIRTLRENVVSLDRIVDFLSKKLQDAGEAAGDAAATAGGGPGGRAGLPAPTATGLSIPQGMTIPRGLEALRRRQRGIGIPVMPGGAAAAGLALPGQVSAIAGGPSAAEQAQTIVGSLGTIAESPGGLSAGQIKIAQKQLEELGFSADQAAEMVAGVTQEMEGMQGASDVVIASFGGMVEAAIRGSQDMEQVVVSTFTNILQSLSQRGGPLEDVLGGFGVPIFGALGGILGAVLGDGGRDREVPVRVERYGREARDILEPIADAGPDRVQVVVQSPSTGEILREFEYEIARRQRRDAVVRFPHGQRPSLGGG